MPRLLHEAERRHDVVHFEFVQRKRTQLALSEKLHQFAEHCSHLQGLVLTMTREIVDRICDIRADGGGLLLSPDSRFADLDKAAARRKETEAARDEIAGQRV